MVRQRTATRKTERGTTQKIWDGTIFAILEDCIGHIQVTFAQDHVGYDRKPSGQGIPVRGIASGWDGAVNLVASDARDPVLHHDSAVP